MSLRCRRDGILSRSPSIALHDYLSFKSFLPVKGEVVSCLNIPPGDRVCSLIINIVEFSLIQSDLA